MELNGIGAVVTGGASGLGLAAAKALLREGAKVSILDIGESRVRQATAGTEIIGYECDVTDEEKVSAVLGKARDVQGPTRINVNCAGIAAPLSLLGRDGPVDLETYSRVLQINLLGTVSVMTKCAEQMRSAGSIGTEGESGVVINTSSSAAYDGMPGMGAYAASKGAIRSLSLSAAREFARYGIRVNSIAPGPFETGLVADIPEDALDAMKKMTVFPDRFGLPEEFGSLVVEVCRNLAFNGSDIRLDGAIRFSP